jgi:hypothetical protein
LDEEGWLKAYRWVVTWEMYEVRRVGMNARDAEGSEPSEGKEGAK